MKLTKYKYICPKCSKKFLSYFFPCDQHYGEFIMRSNNGEMRYLNSFKDDVFDELANICDMNPKLKGISRSNEASIFQRLFSFTCETATDGSRFEIGKGAVCTYCGYHNLDEVPVEVENNINIDIPNATHNQWDSLSESDKRNLINSEIDLLLKN